MIGELTQGDCSMYGAWGSATGSNNNLLQLRALDWDIDGPFQNFPQITVYHPTYVQRDGVCVCIGLSHVCSNESNGHAFANIGWTGWLGSITGAPRGLHMWSYFLSLTVFHRHVLKADGYQRDWRLLPRRHFWQHVACRRPFHVPSPRCASV